jgi:cytoskeletal protein CcmA (bactofilin family)
LSENNDKKAIVVDPVADGVVNRVAAGTVQTGDLQCAGGLWVEGRIVGNLTVDGVLVLDVGGEIRGNVHVRGPRACLAGTIAECAEGIPSEVVVDGVAELGETLRAKANLTAYALDWYNGALIEGKVRTVERQLPVAA